ncbi:hypothetical protein FQN50_006881 [Emmonsiellopsis sp. PD_5]|nr:hypothetical protein FQN50_006881 [Emmonsiellopsis sp. PD_5]
MGVIRYCCGLRSRQPKSTDLESDVYPVHLLDDARCFRSVCPSYLFRFNDVLDAERLSNSLSKLLEIGDWRKLGGRFRLKGDGRLEIVVPKHFTVEKPAFTFTQDVLHSSIEDHPLGRRLPKPTNKNSVQPLHSDTHTFIGPGGSVTTKKMIKRQTPLISLHVASFTDATIVVFTWPHVLMDAMGTRALLHNWSLVLNGKEEEVSAVASAREDFLEKPELEGESLNQDLVIGRKQATTARLLIFQARMAFQSIFRPGFEERAMVLEEKHFHELKSRAQIELASAVGRESEANELFITDGDVLAAWAARMVALSHPKERLITFLSVINARFRLPVLRRNPREEYIHNLVVTVYFNLSPHAASGSLGQIALIHRRNVSEQSTEQQTLGFLRMQSEHSRKHKDYNHKLGDLQDTLVTFNNVTKVDILQAVDFNPAVLKQGGGDESRTNPMGTALYFIPIWTQGVNWLFRVHLFYVLGKDHAGNYQITAYLPPQTWARIEEELNAL